MKEMHRILQRRHTDSGYAWKGTNLLDNLQITNGNDIAQSNNSKNDDDNNNNMQRTVRDGRESTLKYVSAGDPGTFRPTLTLAILRGATTATTRDAT